MKKLLVGAIVVVAISAVFFAVGAAREKRRLLDVERRLDVIRSLAQQAEIVAGKPLHKITNQTCSECPCRAPETFKNTKDASICVYNWNNAILSIWRAIGRPDIAPDWLLRDPWGAPFLLNENVTGELCYTVILGSAGPDKAYPSDDDVHITFKTMGCRESDADKSQPFVESVKEPWLRQSP